MKVKGIFFEGRTLLELLYLELKKKKKRKIGVIAVSHVCPYHCYFQTNTGEEPWPCMYVQQWEQGPASREPFGGPPTWVVFWGVTSGPEMWHPCSIQGWRCMTVLRVELAVAQGTAWACFKSTQHNKDGARGWSESLFWKHLTKGMVIP